jgi:Rieske Fe-S protein
MPSDPSPSPSETSRRGMLLGVGIVGLAGTLSACGGSKSDTSADPAEGSGNAPGQGSGGGALGKASDVPVGGGKIYPSQKVVVTQPKQGEFKAFSAVCTHRGCTVGSISGGKIHCPCHGSAFNVADGSVANGPAAKPLPAKQVSVQNGELKLG